MIRALAAAAILGIPVAVGLLCAVSPPASREAVAVAASGRGPEVKPEDYPICTAMSAIGSQAEWAPLDPDFAAGKNALAAQDWNGAITAFKLAALREPRNADIANYIGYAYRRLDQPGPAMGYYQQALTFNPRHRGAHEHLGELLVLLREPAQAEQHLAALERICLIPCEELRGLQRVMTAYRSSAIDVRMRNNEGR